MSSISLQPALIYWLFGLHSAGKTTLARAFYAHHLAAGHRVSLLDDEEVRAGLCADLGFTAADHRENLRRAAHLAQSHAAEGGIVICAFITPMEQHRAIVRQILGPCVRMVHIDCPLGVCVARDVKGHYAKAVAGELIGMTGTQDTFEHPSVVDAVISTHRLSVQESLQSLLLWTETASNEQRATSNEQRATSN